jgi:protein-tyrosine-phosphatase
MNILFVCQANVGRSQAAMELYRQKGGTAESAGTKVDTPGATLAERPGAFNIVEIMKEDFGIDMINNVRTQINETTVDGFEKIIVMAERETVPEWLFQDKRVEFWTINDPKGQDMDTTRRIVHEIEAKVSKLA